MVIKEIAPKLSIATATLHRWVEQAEVDAGDKPGVTSNTAEESCRLKRENQEL
jgi:transposase, ISMyma03_aa1